MKSIHCLRPGSVVRVSAGRDKGNLMVVLAADESFVYVADGKHRMVEKPKRKKAKHVQALQGDPALDLQQSSGTPVANAALRRALRAIREEYSNR